MPPPGLHHAEPPAAGSSGEPPGMGCEAGDSGALAMLCYPGIHSRAQWMLDPTFSNLNESRCWPQ